MSELPWDVIIPAVIDLIKTCIEARADRNSIVRHIRRPNFLVRIKAERIVRDAVGASRAQWRNEKDALMHEFWNEVDRAPDADLEYLVDLAAIAA